MSRVARSAQLRRYGEAIRLWLAGFDTAAIAARIDCPEPQVERWVWNFREMTRSAVA